MGQPAEQKVEIKDFAGLMDNMDPRDPAPGAAQRLVNAAIVKQGELQIRLGLKPVTFES